MGNQPHVHSVEEVKANIKRIEHNKMVVMVRLLVLRWLRRKL